MSRKILRWALLLAFCASGVYLFSWAVQSASLSVAAEPFVSEILKTRALVLLPMSMLFFAVGILFFICLRREANRG